MQHTDLAALSGAYINSGWSTVYQADTVIPSDHCGWYAFNLDTPFCYNGEDNLLVDFSFNNTDSDADPVPVATYTCSDYASCFSASAKRDDPFTWTSWPRGRKDKFEGGRLVDIRLTFSNEPLPQICSNLSFEDGARGFLTNVPGWRMAGSIYGGAIKSEPVLHGTNVLKMWKGTAGDSQRLYQWFDIVPSNAYVLNGHILSKSTERFSGSNAYGALRIEWYGTGGLLTADESDGIGSSAVADVWHSCVVSGQPPVNCTSGRIVCALFCSPDQEGSLYFDRLSLVAAAGTPASGSPVGTNTPPVSRMVDLCDEFNDTECSNLWERSGWWDGTSFSEGAGCMEVAPGTNDWHTAAYASAEPLCWCDTNDWYVFSAVLSTVRVDAAGSGEDMDCVLALCSAPDNPWWVTNSCSLYGHYDLENDTLRIRFLTKTDQPADNGMDRYGATLQQASRYFGPTNGICMSIALGGGCYEVRVADRDGVPLTLNAVWGAVRGEHLMSNRLYEAYWFVGAQNDNTNRGAVFWDRTEVFRTHAPTVTLCAAAQTSRDGRGMVAVTCCVYDADGEDCTLQMQVTTNCGASWSEPYLVSAASVHGAGCCTGAPGFITAVAATNESGMLVENRMSAVWDTQHAGNEVLFSGCMFSNAGIRVQVYDASVGFGPVTGAWFLIDNAAPSAAHAGVTPADGAAYSWNADVPVAWSGFTDAGTGISGYYLDTRNNAYTTTGQWASAVSAVYSNLPADQCSTVYVWAVDGYGNIGDSAGGTVTVLSESGDCDGDTLINTSEQAIGTSPVNPDSDGDEMPDGWEYSFGLDPVSPDDGVEDADGDGYDNRSEYITGTGPSNAASFLKFHAVSSVDRSVLLEWNSISNRDYSIWQRACITDAWERIAVMPGTGTWQQYTGAVSDVFRAQFRLQVQIPP
jgi:hypothetical protein